MGPAAASLRASRADAGDRPDDLADSPRIEPAGGLTHAMLVVATDPVTLGGRHAREPVSYNGLPCGPTLVLRPGGSLDLLLVNRIAHTQGGMPYVPPSRGTSASHVVPGTHRPRHGTHAMAGMGGDPHAGATTNLHFHGLHVSPRGVSDDPFLRVARNESQFYHLDVPADHPAGLFWYHPHVHGLVTNQLGRGAAGLVSVENAWTDGLRTLGIRRRLLQLHQAYFASDGRTLTFADDDKNDTSNTVALSLVNGRLLPTLALRPGEPQVWALANTSTTAWYQLVLDGHAFDVIAEDGVPLRAVRAGQARVLLPPAKRLEFVVRGATVPGQYALRLERYEQGADVWPAKVLATVAVAGARWHGPDVPGVDASVPLDDLRAVPAAARRTIRFGEDPAVPDGGYGGYLIDGRPYDPARIDVAPTLGTVEEWTVVNDSDEEHPFHLHTNSFQVTHVNGAPQPFDGYQDTVRLERMGTVTFRVRFADFVGRTLMHCHIVDHECGGMMAQLEIRRSAVAASGQGSARRRRPGLSAIA